MKCGELLKAALLTTAFSAAAVGATQEHANSPFETAEIAADAYNDSLAANGISPLLPTEAVPFEKPANTLPPQPDAVAERALLAQDAPIHYVMIHAPNAQPLPDHPEAYDNWNKLLNRDPEFMGSLLFLLAAGTFNDYHPTDVTADLAAETYEPANGCVDSSQILEENRLEAFAKKYVQAGALNFILIDAPMCDAGLAGYGIVGRLPVGGLQALGGLGSVTLHEFGHGAGLGHAGSVACSNVIMVANCAPVAEKSDPSSIMAYDPQNNGFKFDAGEVFNLGLLESSQVLINPPAGQYEIGDFGLHADSPDQIMLLRISTAGRVFNFSYEPDNKAPNDTLCQPWTPPTKKTRKKAMPPGPYLSSVTGSGSVGYTCYAVNERPLKNSLQVRYEENRDGLISGTIVLRSTRDQVVPALPDTNPYPLVIEPEIGEVDPGPVYEDNHVEVDLLGFTPDGKALVGVGYK